MPKFLESAAEPRPPHGMGSGLVRRLPALHLLFHDSRPLHRDRRLDHPLRRGVQVGHDPRFGHAARSAPGPAAGSSGCGRRSPPCWPPQRCRSCSTTPSPFTAATCSRRWRGSTPIPSACRWRCCSSGSSRVPSGKADTAAGPRSCSPAACSRTSSRGCTRWAAPSSSRSSSCCRHAGGSPTRRCGLAQRRHCGSGSPDPHPLVGRLDGRDRAVALGLVAGAFRAEHAYSSSMGYTNVEGWAQYFREADAWALVLAGIGAVTAVVTRSRFGITVTVLGIVAALATAVDPQGSLYNVRLLPLWFISVYFMAAWAFGTWCIIVATAWRRARDRRWRRQRRSSVGRGPAAPPPGRARIPSEPAAEAGHASPPGGHRPLGTGRGQRRRPRPARGDGGGRAALHLPGVVRSRSPRAQRGHELVQLQLRGLPGPGVLPRVPLHHRRRWRRSASATAAAARCGSTARARTASARPRR